MKQLYNKKKKQENKTSSQKDTEKGKEGKHRENPMMRDEDKGKKKKNTLNAPNA